MPIYPLLSSSPSPAEPDAAESIEYAAITYAAGFDSDYSTSLRARYLAFLGGDVPGWQIKAGVTLPAPIAEVGDTGFVVEDTATQTLNWAMANDQLVGGLTGDAATDGSDVRWGKAAIQVCSGVVNDSGKRWMLQNP